MQRGDRVITPLGIGICHSHHLDREWAIIEVDYRYLVEYPAKDVKPYPAQEEMKP